MELPHKRRTSAQRQGKVRRKLGTLLQETGPVQTKVWYVDLLVLQSRRHDKQPEIAQVLSLLTYLSGHTGVPRRMKSDPALSQWAARQQPPSRRARSPGSDASGDITVTTSSTCRARCCSRSPSDANCFWHPSNVWRKLIGQPPFPPPAAPPSKSSASKRSLAPLKEVLVKTG